MRDKLVKIVHSKETTAGRVFDTGTIFLILISVVIQTIETLPNLTPFLSHIFSTLELIITVIFTVEYALRVYVADRKGNYIFSVFGIVDLLAILPYYVTFGSVNLQVLRLLRLIRVFRIFKFVRYNNAVSRYKEAFKSIKEEAVLFSVQRRYCCISHQSESIISNMTHNLKTLNQLFTASGGLSLH